jgi:hypothetical protein
VWGSLAAFALWTCPARAQVSQVSAAVHDPRSEAAILTEMRGLFGNRDLFFLPHKSSLSGKPVDGPRTELKGDYLSIFIGNGTSFRCNLGELGDIAVHEGHGLFASAPELTFDCAETGGALMFFSHDGRALSQLKADLQTLARRAPPPGDQPESPK